MRCSYALSLMLLLSGCGGPTFRGGIYSDDGLRYRLGDPKGGFEQVDIGDNDVSYASPELGTIGVNATCEGYDDVPAQALLNHLLFGTTERKLLLEETVTLDGRGALHAVYHLALDGVPVSLETYVLTKDGCVFDFSYVAAVPPPAAGVEGFHRLVTGFALLSMPNP